MPTLFLLVKRAGVKLIISALCGNKIIMIASLDYTSVIKYHYNIGIPNCRESVSDDKYRSALHQSIHALLNNGFSSRVNRGGRLVENHNRRIGNCRSCDCKQLTLTL